MKPAFLKVIANKEALRIRHGKAEEEMSSIHLRHLPRSPVLSPPWLPSPRVPRSTPLAPHPGGSLLGGREGPDPSRFLPPQWLSAAGAAARGGPSRAASPPSHPAGSGDSPPPETADKLGRECQSRPLYAFSATPARRPSEPSPPSCYLPSAHPARERGSR